MGRNPKEVSELRSESVLVRLTKQMRKDFRQICNDEYVDMSVKIRQLIAREITAKQK